MSDISEKDKKRTDTDDIINNTIPIEKTWTLNIERVLDHLRINCSQLSEFHKYKYHTCKRAIKWYRIPIITFSAINTFASVGLQEHLKQEVISIISSGISLLCGIITGIEIFMQYQDKMETELATHKEYYRISIDIFKMISIDRKYREHNGKKFLDEKFNEYEKIKSRCRPEDTTDLIYDILSDMEDLYVYKRNVHHKNTGWINKYELAPPVYVKPNSKLIGVSYDRIRNPNKYALREQCRKLENKVKVTQKYLDNRWTIKKNDSKNKSQDNSNDDEYENNTDLKLVNNGKRGFMSRLSSIFEDDNDIDSSQSGDEFSNNDDLKIELEDDNNYLV